MQLLRNTVQYYVENKLETPKKLEPTTLFHVHVGAQCITWGIVPNQFYVTIYTFSHLCLYDYAGLTLCDFGCFQIAHLASEDHLRGLENL